MTILKEIELIKMQDDNFIIINLVNGNADIIKANVAVKLLKSKFELIEEEIINNLISRKYIF